MLKMLEKQFYDSVNLKLMKDLILSAEEIENENKNRRNKVLSEHQIEELLDPIKKNQIVRELEVADTEDIINNSVKDHEYERQRDMDEEEEERDCDEPLILE